MAWCNESPGRDEQAMVTMESIQTLTSPSCNHSIQHQDQVGVQHLPGLPAGVKFDPSDQVILEHLEAKVLHETQKLHPLIDKFIPTLEGENGICYTHPDKLPGSSVEAIDNESQPNKLASTSSLSRHDHNPNPSIKNSGFIEFYNPNLISYSTNVGGQSREMIQPQLIPNLSTNCQVDHGSLLYNLQTGANKGGDGSS